MKKLLAVIALVAFLGGMGAPVIAQKNASILTIELADKDPKKKDKKAEAKSGECTSAKEKACEKSCEEKCDKKCDDKKK